MNVEMFGKTLALRNDGVGCVTSIEIIINNNDYACLARLTYTDHKFQTHKRFKRALFIGTKHNVRILGVISYIKLQNDTYTTDKR